MKKDSGEDIAKPSSWDKFKYWFDNRMAKGSLTLMRFLIAVSVIIAFLLAAIIIVFGLQDKEAGLFNVFWDSISTMINAEVPSAEDGNIGYILIMALVALAGVLFTSVLIGIITSAIEEKISDLKRGNSRIIEEGHIIILGFTPGEYTLIQQLILAAAGKPGCIVVAADEDRVDMEEKIKDNVDIPKNFKIICRSIDLFDPVSLEKCSFETCKTVIVSPTEDTKTVRIILAVAAVLEKKQITKVKINAVITKKEHRIPPSIAVANNITSLHTNETLAKMIAHSCTQAGLSETFREIFNYEGNEFYLSSFKGLDGLTFEQVTQCIDEASPIGVWHNNKIKLNPPSDYIMAKGDKLLVFAMDDESGKLVEPSDYDLRSSDYVYEAEEKTTNVVIFGANKIAPTIIKELPENVSQVIIAGKRFDENNSRDIQKLAEGRNIEFKYVECDTRSETSLLEVVKQTEHVVVLTDHEINEDDADMEAVFLLMYLRDIRERYGFSYNITTEMRKGSNQRLIEGNDHTDFVVASSMSSLFLAQLAERAEISGVFKEILSNKGNEIFLKKADSFGLIGWFNTATIRRVLIRNGFSFLGIVDGEKRSVFNPGLNEEIELHKNDQLIVLGEE